MFESLSDRLEGILKKLKGRGFLKEEEVLSLLEAKPEKLELVLTGRGATEKIIEKADLVSEVREVKHPYSQGIKSREGVEY